MTRQQLLERDIAGSAIDRAVRSGRLLVVHEGVYTPAPLELLSEEGALIAARLAVGDCTALGFGTAAYRWQLTPAPPRKIILVTQHSHESPPGLDVRKVRLRAGDVVECKGIPTTSVLRTVLDLAIHYSMQPLLDVMAEAEFHHNVWPSDYDHVLRRGHAGSANLRQARALHVPGYGQARSRLERRFRKMLIEAGIELPVRNQRIGPWRVDCLWPHLRLVVELDGGQHERPHQSAVDAERDLWLRRNRYIVVRYSWTQVYDRREAVIAELRVLGVGNRR